MQRFDPQNCLLLVIDIQGKLAQLVLDKEQVIANTQRLIRAAQILGLPVLLTEQAPQKIGTTIEEIATVLKVKPLTKTTFSCALNHEFMKALRSFQRKQIIVCGIEAHVCVYQTVCDLREQQFDVQVVADAVSSRHQQDRELAFKRMTDVKASLTSTEMIICELLQGADHPKFKNIMALIK